MLEQTGEEEQLWIQRMFPNFSHLLEKYLYLFTSACTHKNNCNNQQDTLVSKELQGALERAMSFVWQPLAAAARHGQTAAGGPG